MSFVFALPRAAVLRAAVVRVVMPLALVVTVAPALHAQGWLQKAKDKARQAAEQAQQKSGTAKPAADSARAGAASEGVSSTAMAVDAGSDFTPGTRVIFATDFTRDQVGDFPRAFQLVKGNMEVVSAGGARYLRATSYAEFTIPLPETLPERFTMEFDVASGHIAYQEIYFVPGNDRAKHVAVRNTDGGLRGDDFDVTTWVKGIGEGAVFPVKVMADGRYVKVYMNGVRVANAPNADLGRSRQIRVRLYNDGDVPVLLGNIRIAAGGKDLYSALSSDGRVTADGILFDSNSDHIRAESAPALKAIGDMLAAHPDVRLAIEGHTDDVGNAATNLSLSDKRAAAVRAYLTSNYGVSPDRLTSKGYGASKPTTSNATADGRAKNRRVELVKVD